jgi:hypothetical protein
MEVLYHGQRGEVDWQTSDSQKNQTAMASDRFAFFDACGKQSVLSIS